MLASQRIGNGFAYSGGSVWILVCVRKNDLGSRRTEADRMKSRMTEPFGNGTPPRARKGRKAHGEKDVGHKFEHYDNDRRNENEYDDKEKEGDHAVFAEVVEAI